MHFITVLSLSVFTGKQSEGKQIYFRVLFKHKVMIVKFASPTLQEYKELIYPYLLHANLADVSDVHNSI